MDLELIPGDAFADAGEEISPPTLCPECSTLKLTDALGKPRAFHLVVEEGNAYIKCPTDGCQGPDMDRMFGDCWSDTLGTEDPIPVTVTFDGPRPGHTHYDQFGCDCDFYLTINPAGES